jgi:hypothetical protein
LAQRQAEHRAQGQRRGDRQVGVARLPAPAGAGLSVPGLDRVLNNVGQKPLGLMLILSREELRLAGRRQIVAWVSSVDAHSPTHVPRYAVRRYSGRPSSSMRFSTLAAMATSVA